MLEQWEALTALLFATTPTPESPHRLLAAMPSLARWRNNPAGIVVAAAARHPGRVALIDDEGSLTFAQLDRRTSALASAWRDSGLGSSSRVGVLAANGRLPLEASIAAQKLGADVIYLNTGFSAPQVADVLADERIDVLVYGEEFAEVAALVDTAVALSPSQIHEAALRDPPQRVRPPATPGRIVVLTSGTTGRPKGAPRDPGRAKPLQIAGLLSVVPVMAKDTMVVAAPLFHGLGLFTTNLAHALGSTVILRRRFDAETTLRDIASNGATVLVAVPAMLQRILALDEKVLAGFLPTTLSIVISGGAPLSGDLATRFMDVFGDVLYNAYGSTETALAAIATPRDLREAPGTTGRPTPGLDVRVIDETGKRAPVGVTGRIVVGSGVQFDGYTDGESKEVIDGRMSTGDLGHVDARGRLYIDGREDDMIVSGGENVFPAEVEDVLEGHPWVYEAAVVGVPDDEFGQRLRAYVVLRPGRSMTEDEARDIVRQRLARFKVPREVVFLGALPRNSTGKVVKRRLP